MKKRLFSLFTSLMLAISLLGVMPAMTVGAKTTGDYEYKILNDGTVTVTDSFASTGNPAVSQTKGIATVTNFKTVSTSTNSVKLYWNKVNGANGYIIYKFDNKKKIWVRSVKTKTTANTCTIRNLQSGTTYKFAVKAYKTINGKEISSASYPIVTTSTNPVAVSGFKAASVVGTTAKLTWNKVAEAQGYIIYRYDTVNKKWVRITKTTANVNSYTVKKT